MWSRSLALTAVLLAPWTSFAQPRPSTGPGPVAAIRTAMEDSLRRQRESVQTQMRAISLSAAGTSTPRPIRPLSAGFANAAVPFQAAGCGALDRSSLEPEITAAADRTGLPSALLHALIAVESGYAPCAVSSKGALGLMQLMPETARELGVGNALDPKENIEGGSRYLQELVNRYRGDFRMALGAYNAGPTQVDRYGGIPPFRETQRYVTEILRRFHPISGAPDLLPVIQ